MNRSRPFILFAALLTCVAAFVLVSGLTLPPLVASHFAGDGHANGSMPRAAYIGLMLCVSVGLPAAIATMHSVILLMPAVLLYMPNYDYWFGPERGEATYAFMRRHGLIFPAILSLFLSYMHWQLVKANSAQPPQLSTEAVVPAIVLFLLAMAIWAGTAILRFARRT